MRRSDERGRPSPRADSEGTSAVLRRRRCNPRRPSSSSYYVRSCHHRRGCRWPPPTPRRYRQAAATSPSTADTISLHASPHPPASATLQAYISLWHARFACFYTIRSTHPEHIVYYALMRFNHGPQCRRELAFYQPLLTTALCTALAPAGMCLSIRRRLPPIQQMHLCDLRRMRSSHHD